MPSSHILQQAARSLPEVQRSALDWFALGVAPRHEKRVSELLQHKGYETFLPLIPRRHQYARRAREFEIPLFPGYLFCRVDLATRLPILTTPGVLQFIGAGRVPLPIEEGEITALQRVVAAGISLEPCAFWKAGQKGLVVDGALKGLEGIVVSIKSRARLILSVSLLKRSVFLEIDSALVTPGLALR